MAVPRNRHSNARKNSKRAHHAKKPKHFGVCTNCNAQKMPHVVCGSCGHYKGRQVIDLSSNSTAA